MNQPVLALTPALLKNTLISIQKICFTQKRCLENFKYTIEDLKTCVSTCPLSHDYFKEDTQECIKPEQCLSPYTKDNEKKLCFIGECSNENKLRLESDGSCVTNCPSTGNDYLRPSTSECISRSSCTGRF